jgi:hypothetical protein
MTYAQGQIGVGIMAATTTYLGDFNNSSIFSNNDIMLGGLVRYTWSDFYCLRINAAGGYLQGDPNTYKGSLLTEDVERKPVAFRNFFFDLDARIEIGFLPYDVFAEKKHRFSPYCSLGIGVLYSKNTPTLQLPVGFGVKYRLTYRLTLGVEWIFAKTFTDDLDGWENIRTSQGFSVMNNDWLTYANIHFVYQLFDDKLCYTCDH